jgi:hypothetical protein
MKTVQQYTLLILIAALVASCTTETDISKSQADTFIKFYGNSYSDQGVSVHETADGGCLVIGTYTNVFRGLSEDKDIFLMKTDKFGNEIAWSPKRYGTKNDDFGNSLELTSDNGYIIAGSCFDTTGTLADIYLIKTNDTGDTLWTKLIGDKNRKEEAYAVKETNDGGFILAGYSQVPGREKDTWIVKTNNLGEKEWSKPPKNQLDDPSNRAFDDFASDVIITSDDRFILIGTTKNNINNPEINTGFITKTSNTGNFSNVIPFPNSTSSFGKKIKKMEDGSYVFTGHSTSTDGSVKMILGFVNEDVTSLTNYYDKIGDEGNYEANDLVVKNNEFYITGTNLVDGNSDIFLVKLDKSGNILFSEKYGNNGSQQGQCIDALANGGFIIVGNNQVEGNSMITLIKVNKEGEFK